MQFLGLGVGAEELDVLAHLGLDLVVVGQRRARRQTEIAQRPPLGRAVFQPFLDDETGCSGGDFTLGRVHRGILPAADVPHTNISTGSRTTTPPSTGACNPLT